MSNCARRRLREGGDVSEFIHEYQPLSPDDLPGLIERLAATRKAESTPLEAKLEALAAEIAVRKMEIVFQLRKINEQNLPSAQ